MSKPLRLASAWGLAAAIVLMTGGVASSQDSLTTARDLYAAAAYEDALALLNRLRAPDLGADESRAIEQYRAFCLLALGRGDEAERAIEAIVVVAPLYHPSDTDVSPRVRAVFSGVRRRMLPAIVQKTYAQAKAAFDRKEFGDAAEGFTQVLNVLADADVASAADRSPLSDLHTLAVGFYELSVTSAAPPPPPPPPPEPAPPPVPALPRIYSADDADVAPPTVVRQSLPPFPSASVPGGRGLLEVVVDETGAVASATMRMPVNAAYDTLALAATKTWRYKPATLNGVPVKFRKLIQISLEPQR